MTDIKKKWEEYRAVIKGARTESEIEAMRRAFFAGAMAYMNSANKIAATEKTKQEMFDDLNDLDHSVLVQCCKEMAVLVDKMDRPNKPVH